jgi:hypothetical protein
MNRNLLLFALFLAVLGVVFGFYLITFFGLLLLIPAALIPSRAPARTPQPPKQAARRTPPPQGLQSMAKEQAPQSMSSQPVSQSMSPQPMAAMSSVPYSSSYQSYSPALFPSSMFPSLSMSGSAQPQPQGELAKKQAERDELVEVGAMLALLKLLLS